MEAELVVHFGASSSEAEESRDPRNELTQAA
jgi:hypothetical protein